MAEVLGTGVVIVLAIYWVVFVGDRTGTTLQSFLALCVYAGINAYSFIATGLTEDEVTYFRYSVNLAGQLLDDPLAAASFYTEGKQSWVWILATVILAFGGPIPGLAINVLLMTTLPAILVSAGRNLGIFSSGTLTAWLVVLAPPLLLWGHGLNREPLVFFLLSCLILFFSWIFQGRWGRGVLGVVAVSLALSVTRSSLLAVVVFGALAFSLLRYVHGSHFAGLAGESLAKKGFTLLGLVTAVLFLPTVWIGLAVLESPFWKNFGAGIPDLSGPEQSTAVVGAEWGYNSSVGGFSYNVARSLIGPMPWEVFNVSLLFFAIEGIGYLVFLSAILMGAMTVDRVRDIGLALGATVLPLVVAASLLLANYGLNSRIRAHIFLLLLILMEPIAVRVLSTWRGRLFENRSPQLRFSRSRVTGRNV